MMSSSQNRTENRHIIWSDMNLNPDDWRDGYKDFLEINEIDGDPNDEHKLYEYMVETNGEYLIAHNSAIPSADVADDDNRLR